MILLQLFYRFLKFNNAFNLFKYNATLNNLKGSGSYKIKNIDKIVSNNLIINAFNWGNTKEGSDYWYELYHKWNKIIFYFDLYDKIASTKISNNIILKYIEEYE